MTRVTGETLISLETGREAAAIKSVSDLASAIQEASKAEATAPLVNILLAGAIALNASDIHVEPQKDTAKVRVRVDGILHDTAYMPLKIFGKLLSRIKLLSGIKLNIADRPQDGRFSVASSSDAAPIEIRTSTIPAEYGESIVTRLLNPQNIITLEKLGLSQNLLSVFREEIGKPNGMIIVTGPTGSGKTTTLYAFLKYLQSPEIKIITIEDPIEYHLEGISQTQISKKYDFANGLKSIMRQDPDVILVGEIRDSETCDIALQASLTGHLVLTTLHTNDSAGTIARLIALDAQPYNIGPAINMAVAQRLARTVCRECLKLAEASPDDLRKLKKELANLPSKIKIPALEKGIEIPKLKGCRVCNQTGYKGRVGIFEAFVVDNEMEKFILKMPSMAELRGLAMRKGMITMRQDGFIKVLNGMTTIEEIERVTSEKD